MLNSLTELQLECLQSVVRPSNTVYLLTEEEVKTATAKAEQAAVNAEQAAVNAEQATTNAEQATTNAETAAANAEQAATDANELVEDIQSKLERGDFNAKIRIVRLI